MSKSSPVTIRIPASTSNCGPGFDTLGCALTLYNFVQLQPKDSPSIEVQGADCDSETQRLVEDAAQLFFNQTRQDGFGFDCEIWGEVPSARGLGSSSTLRAGIVAGLNHLTGASLDREALVRLVASLDHAPDNAAACVFGGFVVARNDPKTGNFAEAYSFPVDPSLSFVVLSPENRVSTLAARQVLPPELPFWETVRSLNSLAGIVGAFASRQYERLRHCVYDGIHQPYRKMLNPFVEEAVTAGMDAGALTGWLSGSGSSVLCLATAEKESAVGRAMQDVFQKNDHPSRVFFLRADNGGLRVEPS